MKIENVIICDQVRKEESGKHLLIGVYPENILFSSFPGKIVLTPWVQISDEGNRKIAIEFRVTNSEGEILITAGGELDATNHSGLLTLTLPTVMFNISNQTILSFQMRESKKRWKTLKQMPAQLRPENK